jgi:hypothetical protein
LKFEAGARFQHLNNSRPYRKGTFGRATIQQSLDKPENHISNYYLLRRLVDDLNDKICGALFESCFSLNKNEIVFVFDQGLVKAYFGAESFLFMEEAGTVPNRQMPQFEELWGKKIEFIIVHPHDRSFRMHLQDGYVLVFMMYGRNGNVLLFRNYHFKSMFRQEFEKHKTRTLQDFDAFKVAAFREYSETSAASGPGAALKQHFGGFSEGMIRYLVQNNIEKADPADQWKMILNFESLLLTGTIDVIEYPGKKITLSLLPGAEDGMLIYSGNDVQEALRQYARKYFYSLHFNQVKNTKLGQVKHLLEKCRSNLSAAEKHLSYLENDSNYKHIADIIMANLSNIPAGAEQANLFDFYNDRTIDIRLKRGLSPQQWAEKLYKKAKNQEIEKQNFRLRIAELEKEQEGLIASLAEIENIDVLKTFKEIDKVEKANQKEVLPFRHISFEGFDIYIGKNAANNDKLTFGFAHKEDLWLHASGVSGSHIVVRHKVKDKPFPHSVIEKAASIAAFFSKSKGSILVPVIYTLRKFVRKPKGAAPGAVIVEKEKMIMAKPEQY